MKKLWMAVILVAAAGCAPQFSADTMRLFPELEKTTAAIDQDYRAAWKAKITAGLKDGPEKAAIQQYLDLHAQQLAGVAATAKNLNAAVQAQQK